MVHVLGSKGSNRSRLAQKSAGKIKRGQESRISNLMSWSGRDNSLSHLVNLRVNLGTYLGHPPKITLMVISHWSCSILT